MRVRLLIPAALLLLAGCGFHLRTWDLETNVASAAVAAQGRSVLDEPLKRSLRNSGVELLEEGAQITIDLLNEQRGRRSISVNDQARTEQYELSLNIQYEIRDESGAVLLPPRWIRALRIYRVDRDNLVGSSEEEALLEREMVNDLIQQLMRSVDAVTRERAVAA
ncbi:MAG: LPS assembly lipoprotein LptE [Pseudomonadales bacterium]|nr:hypothetical protein [Pseudomonadales bacterium]